MYIHHMYMRVCMRVCMYVCVIHVWQYRQQSNIYALNLEKTVSLSSFIGINFFSIIV
jgi:hypothetical protein